MAPFLSPAFGSGCARASALELVLAFAFVAGLAGGGVVALAQGSPPVATPGQPSLPGSTPTGTVTGHVYCTDTQRLARFAEVEVMREVMAPPNSNSPAAAMPTYQGVARARTALDGSFIVSGVPTGDYFVVATQTGYINAITAARTAGRPLSGAPMVHVAEGRSVDAAVSLDRGAVVTGRLTYDDGSPVAGVPVSVRTAMTAGMSERFGGFNGFFGNTMTDDRGVFRTSGLAPGKYVVAATVQTETSGVSYSSRNRGYSVSEPINVYAPGTQHRGEARTLDLRGGETVDGADIVVTLAGLHSVKGSVEAKADAHLLNSGYVTLADAADGSFTRTASVGPDGTFAFEYLPAGSYTLSVSGADRSSAPRGPRDGPDTTVKRYQSASTGVALGEHDLVLDPVMLVEAVAAR